MEWSFSRKSLLLMAFTIQSIFGMVLSLAHLVVYILQNSDLGARGVVLITAFQFNALILTMCSMWRSMEANTALIVLVTISTADRKRRAVGG